MRYVSGTKYLGIMYSTVQNLKLIGYTYSDNGGSTNDRESTSGYTFHFGTGVVSWDSKKQPIVTLSSVEVKCSIATSIASQAIWMRRMLKDMSQKQQEPTSIFCANNSTISLSKNHVFHKKTKHINTRYHFIIELMNNKEICLEFCKSEDQLAYIFTKLLARDTF